VCAVLAVVPRLARADAACAGNALVTLEDGAIVNVEWPERTAAELRGRAVTNATLATEYQIALRPDVVGSIQAWSWLPSRRLSNQLLDTLASGLTAKRKLGTLRGP